MLGLTMPLCSDNGGNLDFRLHYAPFGRAWQAGLSDFSIVKFGTVAVARSTCAPSWPRAKKRRLQCHNPS